MTEILSKTEMEKIRCEEIFREEVRSSLSNQTERNFIVSFLETQHGIFIASALVLPLILWFFAFIQSHYTSFKEEQVLMKTIDNEISYRISNHYSMIHNGNLRGFKTELDNRYVYPQFSGIGIQGLMLQLEDLVPDAQRKEIVDARKSLVSGDDKEVKSRLEIREWLLK